MAYTVPSVADFRARFPEFPVADVPDPIVASAISEATQFVNQQWPEPTYGPAILYLAAHFVYLGQIGTTGDIGELLGRMRSISYGPMSIGFGGQQSSVGTPTMQVDQYDSVYLARFRMFQPDPWSPVVLEGA